MEKCDIIKLISSKSERISFSKKSGHSEVWPFFETITVDEAMCSFVRCKPCGALLKWKSRDGTSGLKAHRQSCRVIVQRATNTQTLTSMLSPSKVPVLSASDRRELTNSLSEMCATDIR